MSAERVIASSLCRVYYHRLVDERDKLLELYGDDSAFSHGEGVEDVEPVHGKAAIAEKLAALRYSAVNIADGGLDVHSWGDNHLLVMVTGFCSLADGPVRAFAQTFVLQRQGKSMYVRNDCLRMIEAAPVDASARITSAVKTALEDETIPGNASVEATVHTVEDMHGGHLATIVPETPTPVATPVTEAPAPVPAPAPAPAPEAEAAEVPAPAPAAPAPAAAGRTRAPRGEKKASPASAASAPAPAPATHAAHATAAGEKKAAPRAAPPAPKTWASVTKSTAAATSNDASAQEAAPAPVAAPAPAPVAAPAPAPVAAPASAPRAAPSAGGRPVRLPGCHVLGNGATAAVTNELLHAAASAFGPVSSVNAVRAAEGVVHIDFGSLEATHAAIAHGTLNVAGVTLTLALARPPVSSGTSAAAAASGAPTGGSRRGGAASGAGAAPAPASGASRGGRAQAAPRAAPGAARADGAKPAPSAGGDKRTPTSGRRTGGASKADAAKPVPVSA